MDITNKTKKPLSVPLPGGKKLFLQPGKTGQITAKALQHPPVVALIQAGDLESADSEHGATPKTSGKASKLSSGKSGPKGSGAMRQSGDR